MATSSPPSSDDRPSSFGFFSRRRFLKWTLIGGGSLLGVGGGAFAGLLSLRGSAPDVPGLRTLSAHEHRTLLSIADTLLPRGGAFPEGALDFEPGRRFDNFLADEPEENISDLKAALFLVEMGPVIFERRLVTFSNMTPQDRVAHWQGWMQAPQLLRRQASLAFKKFLAIVFYDQETVWPSIGYPGPSMDWEDAP